MSIAVKFIPTSKTQKDAEYDHIHPAFENGSASGKNNNFMNGEWREEIPGFWVAKFPAGYQQNTITDNDGTLNTTISNESNTLISSDENYTNTGNYTTVAVGEISTSTQMTLPVFLPLTYAYNCICIGDSFTLAKQVTKSTQSKDFYGLNSSVDSHMLKNSEWGAVAYLTHSQYGRNGVEPNINNYYDSTKRSSLTGIYANGTSNSQTTALGKPWYEETIGMLGSSTGNRTGVYDLNGCVWECVSSFVGNGKSRTSVYIGNSNWIKRNEYAMNYPYNTIPGLDGTNSNWDVYKNAFTSEYGYGDAVLIGSPKYTTTSEGRVNGDQMAYPANNFPFFRRRGEFE